MPSQAEIAEFKRWANSYAVGGPSAWVRSQPANGAELIMHLFDRLETTEKLLQEWSERWAKMEGPINSVCAMSQIHGVPYAGPTIGDLPVRTSGYFSDQVLPQEP